MRHDRIERIERHKLSLDLKPVCQIGFVADMRQTYADVPVEADEIKLGDASATQAIALGTAVKGHLDALKSFLDALTRMTISPRPAA